MIENFFINEITVKSKEQTVYEGGISKKQYAQEKSVRCRISHLSYKDLQLIAKTDDVWKSVMKLYTSAEEEITTKDKIFFEWKERTIIATYHPQDKTKVHHHKYFIKKVE